MNEQIKNKQSQEQPKNGLTQTERAHLDETKKTYHRALEQLSRL
ncbi:MAG: hypothetical protein WCC86_07225 [Methanoregula sp.]|jgi:hypothetical protein